MVDVVDLAAAVAQLDEDRHHGEQVVVRERGRADLSLGSDALVEPAQPARRALVDLLGVGAAVELHPADRREVVALLGVEEAVEEGLHRILGGRLAGTHHAVDRDLGGPLVDRLVGAQRLGDVRTLVEVVRVERADLVDAGKAQLRHQLLVDLLVRVRDDLARVLVDHVVGERAAQQEVLGHREALEAGRLEVADVLGGDALVLRDDRLAAAHDVEARDFAAHALGHELELDAGLADEERVGVVEHLEDLLGRHADRLQQDRDRHLAAAVDAEEEEVLRVELEVEPRAAVGDDARGEEELSGRVRLAAVVLEEHARRTVQLRDDHALGAVDDERARLGHERYLAHVDLLLLHLLDRRLGRLLVHDREAHLRAQRRRVGEPPLLALLDVERRLAEHVRHEVEPRVAAVRADREDRRESGLQALARARLRRHRRLEERRVGLELRGEQERDVQHARALGEALADPLFLGRGVGRGSGRHVDSG